MKTFEVELRALLTEKQYKSLLKHFNSVAKGIKNDTATWAFLTKDLNIKIKNMVDKKKANIMLKNGPEYKQHVNEYELPIDPKDVDKAVAFMTALGFKKHIPSFQKRVDYKVDNIIVSLKHEIHWGYQVEVETLAKSKTDIVEAKKKLHNFLKQFNVTPMTQREMRALTNKTLKKLGIKLI